MRPFLSSLTRICELQGDLPTAAIAREHWAHADLVVVEMLSESNALSKLELATGRMIDLMRGDRLVGALGRRQATLECVGSFEDVGTDLVLDLMTPGGLLGKITSQSSFLGPLPKLRYCGHLMVQGEKANLKNYVGILPTHPLHLPVILVIGTSMSAGKTASAKCMIRILKEAGLGVLAAKLTGAARYRDVLSMQDAGADRVYDFVDVGLPSTVCPEDEFEPALQQLLSRLALHEAEVVVVEAGASPLEPYNGACAVRHLLPRVVFSVLAASDPYAVAGVMQAFEFRPDLVTGVATNTSAGLRLVEKLTGAAALNLLDETSREPLRQMLLRVLDGRPQGGVSRS